MLVRQPSPMEPAEPPSGVEMPPADGAPEEALEPPPPPDPCFNTQYRFICALPRGFIITQEADGPGIIMTLVQQSVSSKQAGNLTVRVSPLGKNTLQRYMELRVTKDLETAKGVIHWDQSEQTYGSYPGQEIIVERQYASGRFKSVIFGFKRGSNAFVIDYSAPAEMVDKDPDVVRKFVDSIVFQS